MSTDGKSRVQQLFLDALEVPAPERNAWLAAQCGDDQQLLREVRSLLNHDSPQDDPLEGPLKDAVRGIPAKLPWDAATVLESTRTATRGTVIGPYTIRQKLGEGGFGVVYLAEQTHPVRRKVALKIIKPGMDSKECIARFEAERQALALMDHPNIANVLEAGTTASGHPFFVMELVRGVPITEFCDAHHMPLRERLELFVSVCRAVQHAHQKGIIHRDLKPSNILVAEDGGQSVVKVIDFGIAKALGQQLTANTLFTTFGQMIGTPLYMSPEQADKNVVDVDTRSDIYSLGVLLYELMTGRTPLDKQRLNQAALEEVRRIIREEDPPSLSRRLSSLEHAELSSISALRGLAPRRMLSLFHGELDWVAMKALEKDRTRRYETAVSFAADIERYLTDQPVQARPASSWYRFRKFVVRHKAGTGVTATVVVGVIAALAGLIASNHLIARERDVKEQALFEREAALRESRRHEQQAQTNADAADANREQALANAALAERERDDKARQLYLAHMNIANQEWLTHHAARTRELLDLYLPDNHVGDAFRSWEWNYLWRLSHSELRLITTTPDETSDPAKEESHITLLFAPDGQFLLTGSSTGRLHIWTADGTKHLRTFQACQGEVRKLAISADGKYVATAGDDGTVILWNTREWSELRAFPGHRNTNYCMALSPRGDRIAVASNEIVIYDTSYGHELRRLTGHSWQVREMQFSTDGRQLISSANDGTSRLWDVESGVEQHRFNMGRGAALSPNGRTIVTSDENGSIAFWDSTTGQQLQTTRPQTRAIQRIVFSPDGSRLATVGSDTTVRVWDAISRRLIYTFSGHGSSSTDVAFSPTSEIVASCGWDRSIRFWDTSSRQEMTVTGPRIADGVTFSPNGQYFAIGGGKTLMLYEDTTRELVWQSDEGAYMDAGTFPLAFDESSRVIASGRQNGTIRVLDVETGHLSQAIEAHQGFVTCLLFLSDGRMVTGGQNGEIVIWRSIDEGFREERRVPITVGQIEAIAVSPSGTILAVGGCDRDIDVRLWDLVENRLIQTLKGAMGMSFSLVFSQDGERLFSGGPDDSLTCWELATGKRLRRQQGHSGSIYGCAISADGRRLVSCSEDGHVKLWDVETGMEVITLSPDLGSLSAVSFSPDSSRLAVSGWQGGVVIYDSRPLTPELRAEPWVADLKTRNLALSLRDQATALETEGKLHEAISILEQLAALPGKQADQHALRNLYARTWQWEQALEVNQAVQGGAVNWQQVALLYELGRHDEYRQARQQLLADSGRVDQQWEIYLYLVAALLLPIEPDLDEAIRRLADGLVESELHWHRSMVGKAKYRLGEFDRWYAELPDESPLKTGHVLLLAATAFKADPSDENRQKVVRWIERQENATLEETIETSGDLDEYWHNYVDDMAWVQEAKRVLDENRP